MRTFTRGIVACLISSVALLCVSTVQAQVEVGARVIHLKGSARYTTDNSNWQPVGVGTYLHAGTTVQTSGDGVCDIVLVVVSALSPSATAFKPFVPSSMASEYRPVAADNVIRLWQNTAVGIDKLTMQATGEGKVTETQLELKQGRISGVANKISPASKYEIKLPKGVAAVRGATFDIQTEGVVKVFTGSVMVAWVREPSANVVTQLVGAHQKYDARDGTVTALAPDEQVQFERLPSDLLAFEYTPPSGVAADLTVTPVSPVSGSGPSSPVIIDQ